MAKVAHFLLDAVLARSPPNDALIRAYRELGFDVDLYAPGGKGDVQGFDKPVSLQSVEYGRRWLLGEAWRPAWRRYSAFSGTSEDPMAVVGLLSVLHRRPAIALADEIKSGSYGGNRPASWKRMCRFGMRRAKVSIVNDTSRIQLQRDYAQLRDDQLILVYPGGYVSPPVPVDRAQQRKAWGISDDAVVIAVSGGFNMTAGADWLIDAFVSSDFHVVVQPVGVEPLARYLLERIQGRERLYLERDRLDWREAWSQAAAADIGLAIYTNPAPQFQHMGTSSNRLCMFLGMGVPVIASRQPSFQFLEEYDCGILVDDRESFSAAVKQIRGRLVQMKANAARCWRDHIATPSRYRELVSALGDLLAA